jgi:hypothetical protein
MRVKRGGGGRVSFSAWPIYIGERIEMAEPLTLAWLAKLRWLYRHGSGPFWDEDKG